MPQHITFRLHDSLPAELLERWKRELSTLDREAATLARRKRIEAALDAGHGACYLRIPQVANVVEDALLYFDGKRYRLYAWVVMPNHVHVLAAPLHPNTLSSILHGWKSFTAKRVNDILGRKGRLWLEEYFDRVIRDERHLAKVIEYIEANPVKARLCAVPEDWPWSSAARRMATTTTEETRAGRPRPQE